MDRGWPFNSPKKGDCSQPEGTAGWGQTERSFAPPDKVVGVFVIVEPGKKIKKGRKTTNQRRKHG